MTGSTAIAVGARSTSKFLGCINEAESQRSIAPELAPTTANRSSIGESHGLSD
jgi:hypothetical protein